MSWFQHLSHDEARNFIIQLALNLFYVVLSVLFAMDKKTWPLAIYYFGCLVKDSGVLALGLLLVSK